MGQDQVSSLSVRGATITGSNTLRIDPTNGLSVVGGLPGLDGQGGTIDPTESITIRFTNPSTGIVMTFPVHGAYGNFPTSQAGEFSAQAFDASGQSIGTVDLTPGHVTGPNNYSVYAIDLTTAQTFYTRPISALQISPIGDANGGSTLSIDELSFTDGYTAPEPSSCLIALALVAAGLYCRGATRREPPRPGETNTLPPR
jgi:hypothetical protein